MMHRLVDCSPPGKGSVIGNEHGGTGKRITLCECLDNDAARILFIIALDLAWFEQACARNAAVKVIGVRRSERLHRTTCLRPGSGMKAMSVGNCADSQESSVKNQMGLRIRTRLELSFNDFARH